MEKEALKFLLKKEAERTEGNRNLCGARGDQTGVDECEEEKEYINVLIKQLYTPVATPLSEPVATPLSEPVAPPAT